MKLTDKRIKKEIKKAFDLNYELLRLDGGHALTPATRKMALDQVMCYWKKLRDVAENVHKTEVTLTLPDERTPKGKKFSIEGTVDIVSKNKKTVMYDLKTHDAKSVRKNVRYYKEQLNVYAHVWTKLQNQPLDELAIIATKLPKDLNKAIIEDDETALENELDAWDPIVKIKINKSRKKKVIREFGEVVDKIESNCFAPPGPEKLWSEKSGKKLLFVTDVCQNCDARYSCKTFRKYMTRLKGNNPRAYKHYLNYLGDEDEIAARNDENLVKSSPIEGQ